MRPKLSYVPHFPKRAGFPLSPFPPSLTYRSKLASASPFVGFLASPTEVGEWIFPTQGRRLRVSARCFYPLGQFQFYSLMDLRQGEKIKNFVHISCAKIGFSSESPWACFPGGERTLYPQNFPHDLDTASECFSGRGFTNSYVIDLVDIWVSREPLFAALFLSGHSESFDLLLWSIVSFPRIDLGPVIGYFIGPQSSV